MRFLTSFGMTIITRYKRDFGGEAAKIPTPKTKTRHFERSEKTKKTNHQHKTTTNMKKFISNISKALLIVGLLFSTWSCSDDWLKPRPLSMYAPENVFVDAAGLNAALTAAERNMRFMWSTFLQYRGAMPFQAEYFFSDIAVVGTADHPRGMNWDIHLQPTADLGIEEIRIGTWWHEAWMGISMANTVISRIDNATFANEAERNAVLGAAYFHRAWRYFNLVNQFGDVPWVGGEIATPTVDFYTYCRWSILRRIQGELEFAWEWMSDHQPLRGRATRAAAGVLLMKVSKSLLDFERAIEVGEEIVRLNPMMRGRFGPNQNDPRTTLMHDLHSTAGMLSSANTEGLLYVVSCPTTPVGGGTGNERTFLMRNTHPHLHRTDAFRIHPPGFPDQTGTMENPTMGTLNINLTYGRGIARTRPTHFFLYDVWDMTPRTPIGDVQDNPGGRHANDIRGPLHRVPARVDVRIWNDVTGNWELRETVPGSGVFDAFATVPVDTMLRTGWRFPEDMVYNHNAMRTHANRAMRYWYGRNLVRPAAMLNPTTDTDWSIYILSWWHWPHFKLFARDYQAAETAWQDGGSRPMYIYRTAEVYLMMAEAHYWLGNNPRAADMLNEVRRRAGATDLAAADINMAMILAERARELYFEEMRNSELTRIAFTYAKMGDRYGRACSVFGRTYSLTNFSGPGAPGVKQTGFNFFFDWITKVNNFIREGVTTAAGATYTMSVHHVLWPIPSSAILANTMGHINQNVGYPGWETNLPPRTVPLGTPGRP